MYCACSDNNQIHPFKDEAHKAQTIFTINMRLFHLFVALTSQIAIPQKVSSFSLSSTPLQIAARRTLTPTIGTDSNSQLYLSKGANDDNPATNNGGDDFGEVAFVLLAGGTGSRMKANMPKQFLDLKGMPILHHSLDLFLNRLPAYAEEKGLRYVLY